MLIDNTTTMQEDAQQASGRHWLFGRIAALPSWSENAQASTGAGTTCMGRTLNRCCACQTS